MSGLTLACYWLLYFTALYCCSMTLWLLMTCPNVSPNRWWGSIKKQTTRGQSGEGIYLADLEERRQICARLRHVVVCPPRPLYQRPLCLSRFSCGGDVCCLVLLFRPLWRHHSHANRLPGVKNSPIIQVRRDLSGTDRTLASSHLIRGGIGYHRADTASVLAYCGSVGLTSARFWHLFTCYINQN